MRLPTLPRKATFALLLVAIVGLADIAGPLVPAPAVALAQLAAAAPAPDAAAAAPQTVTVVQGTQASLLQYLDLIIRVLALLVAWLTQPKPAETAPAPLAPTRNGYR